MTEGQYNSSPYGAWEAAGGFPAARATSARSDKPWHRDKQASSTKPAFPRNGLERRIRGPARRRRNAGPRAADSWRWDCYSGMEFIPRATSPIRRSSGSSKPDRRPLSKI